MYKKIDATSIEKATIRFYYDYSQLFEDVAILSNFMAKNLATKDGVSLTEDYALSRDEQDLFDACVVQSMPDIADTMAKISYGVVDAFGHFDLVYADEGRSFSPGYSLPANTFYLGSDTHTGSFVNAYPKAPDFSTTVYLQASYASGAVPNPNNVYYKVIGEDYVYFRILDNDAYNENILTIVDACLYNVVKYGILKEYYSNVLQPDALKLCSDRFVAEVFKLNQRLFQLKKKVSSRLSANLVYDVTEINLVPGDTYTNPLSNPRGLPITYSCSNGFAATIDENGEVTARNVSTAVITATSPATQQFSAGVATYNLTVAKIDPELNYETGFVLKNMLDSSFTNPLTNPHSLVVTYSSDNTSVATVDSTGAVTIVGAGACSITASFTATTRYEADSTSFHLVVQKVEAGIYYAETEVEKTLDQVYYSPDFNNPNLLEVTFSSSDESIATVDSGGIVYFVATGTVTITATTEETSVYRAGSASFTLVVLPAKASAGISFNETEVERQLDEQVYFSNFNNPNNLEVTFASSDESVATVEAGGIVYFVAPGTVTITATSEETSEYHAGSASFTLTITS